MFFFFLSISYSLTLYKEKIENTMDYQVILDSNSSYEFTFGKPALFYWDPPILNCTLTNNQTKNENIYGGAVINSYQNYYLYCSAPSFISQSGMIHFISDSRISHCTSIEVLDAPYENTFYEPDLSSPNFCRFIMTSNYSQIKIKSFGVFVPNITFISLYNDKTFSSSIDTDFLANSPWIFFLFRSVFFIHYTTISVKNLRSISYKHHSFSAYINANTQVLAFNHQPTDDTDNCQIRNGKCITSSKKNQYFDNLSVLLSIFISISTPFIVGIIAYFVYKYRNPNDDLPNRFQTYITNSDDIPPPNDLPPIGTIDPNNLVVDPDIPPASL